jgi:integrase
MGRPANPTPTWDPDRKVWTVRVTMPKPPGWPAGREGPRKLHDLPGIPEDEPKRAKVIAKIVSDKVRRGEAAPMELGETCDDYADRWIEAREAAGLLTTADDRGRWDKWIAPHLGGKPITAVTEHDLKNLVASLDKSVRAGELRWKTAENVWGVVTVMFNDARKHKNPALCVRKDNPAVDVKGPDRGHDRASAFLFPSEIWKLLACELVPLARRRVYTLAIYTGCRAGELRALRWEDMHEAEGFVSVHRSRHRSTNEEKGTKTGKSHPVRVEPALLPLLKVMREESGGEGGVLQMHKWDWPEVLRADLKVAKVERAELEADDETRRPLDFHDLRHTYGTLRAIRGDAVVKISRAMGHTNITTTQRYINEAEAFEGAGFGIPLGPLPPEVLGGVSDPFRRFGSKRPNKPRQNGDPSGGRTRTLFRAADFKSAAYAIPPRGPGVRDHSNFRGSSLSTAPSSPRQPVVLNVEALSPWAAVTRRWRATFTFSGASLS